MATRNHIQAIAPNIQKHYLLCNEGVSIYEEYDKVFAFSSMYDIDYYFEVALLTSLLKLYFHQYLYIIDRYNKSTIKRSHFVWYAFVRRIRFVGSLSFYFYW